MLFITVSKKGKVQPKMDNRKCLREGCVFNHVFLWDLGY